VQAQTMIGVDVSAIRPWAPGPPETLLLCQSTVSNAL